MRLQDFFKKVVVELNHQKIRFALAGGLLASVYRDQQRTTRDLDFLILAQNHTEKKAIEIIESFGLTAHVIRKAELEGGPLFSIKRKNTPPCIIIGREKDNPNAIGLDFILPNIPWFQSALERAETHLGHFSFGPVPCLTVEDLIISKLYSYKNDASRFQDLDDLKSIFLACEKGKSADLIYISSQLQSMNLKIPKLIQKHLPKALRVLHK